MKYVFLNPDSCSGLARKKWNTIQSGLKELQGFKLVDKFYSINWNDFNIQTNDSFFSAGGDGTIHSMVNGLIKHKGIGILSQIKVGHIGIGSNNSFLRPYENYKSFETIPYAISKDTYKQDLIQITIDDKEQVICVANSSIGFLAHANKIFNSSRDVAFLKKINPDLADSYTVLKTLFTWRPFAVKFQLDNKVVEKKITNIHLMKKPFYASDLRFPEEIEPAGGNFHLQILYELPKHEILTRFVSLMVKKNFEAGRDFFIQKESFEVESAQTISLEVDGEIYKGRKFVFQIIPGAINLCR